LDLVPSPFVPLSSRGVPYLLPKHRSPVFRVAAPFFLFLTGESPPLVLWDPQSPWKASPISFTTALTGAGVPPAHCPPCSVTNCALRKLHLCLFSWCFRPVDTKTCTLGKQISLFPLLPAPCTPPTSICCHRTFFSMTYLPLFPSSGFPFFSPPPGFFLHLFRSPTSCFFPLPSSLRSDIFFVGPCSVSFFFSRPSLVGCLFYYPLPRWFSLFFVDLVTAPSSDVLGISSQSAHHPHPVSMSRPNALLHRFSLIPFSCNPGGVCCLRFPFGYSPPPCFTTLHVGR